MKSWILKNVALPIGDALFQQGIIRRLKYIEQAQWWEPSRIESERLSALRRLIATSYREVPFYRSLMVEARVEPRDIRSTDDLRRLPVVTKQMLSAGYPRETVRSTGLKTFEACTSGSTGKNFRVLADPETVGRSRAAFLLALEWAGWELGEHHVQTGMNLGRSADRRWKDWLLGCHYVSSYDLREEHLTAILAVMERRRIQHLWGYPGSLYYLARAARAQGWNQPLTSIVTWGDNLYPQYRRTMEEAFGARVTDTYGCAEEIQMSAQCGVGNNYHVHSLDVILEYLDESGEPVAPGSSGHVIVTRLHPGPMPLIRYRVGDMAVKGDGKACGCGRGFESMGGIEGRDTDVVITPSGNRLIVHFFTGILEHFPEIDSFEVVQEETESIVVRVVPAPTFSRQTASEIVAALERKGATGLRILVDTVDALPLMPNGKRRFVRSTVASRAAAREVGQQAARGGNGE